MPQMPSMKRPASPTPTPTPGPESPAPSSSAVSKNKKRKPNAADSPARLDGASPAPDGSPNGDGGDEEPAPISEYDLTRMAKRIIPRQPVFQPVSEGPEWFSTPDVPPNRMGFRYILAGCSTPSSKTVDKTLESYPPHLRFSWEDRSPYVRVTQDGMSITTEKGFRSARGNVPVREGKWYMEVEILRGGGEGKGEAGRRDGAHVRLGWGRREAPLNGPVGMDGYSYGLRDLTGDKVTLSRPRPYAPPFGSGDVIGMYISLPPRRQPNPKDTHDPARIVRKRIPIQFKGQVYFESVEYPQNKEMQSLLDYSSKKAAENAKKNVSKGPPGQKVAAGPTMRPLPTLQGSAIAFFVNGKPQGVAFRDVYDFLQLRLTDAARKAQQQSKGGMAAAIMKERENNFDDGSLGYYPFVSVFNDAQVRLNPGPDFKYPPPADIDAKLGLPSTSKFGEPTWRPMSERYNEYMSEVWAQDAIDAVELNAEAHRILEDRDKDKLEEARKEERRRRDRERAALKRKEKENIKLGKESSTPRDSLMPESPALRNSSLLPKLETPDDVDEALLGLAETPLTNGKTDDLDEELLEAAGATGRKSTAPDDLDEELLEVAGSPRRALSRPNSEDIDEELLEAASSDKPAKRHKSEVDELEEELLEAVGSVEPKSSPPRKSEEVDDIDEALLEAVSSKPKTAKAVTTADWDEDEDELLAAVASDARSAPHPKTADLRSYMEDDDGDDDLDLLASIASDSRPTKPKQKPMPKRSKVPSPDLDSSEDELLLSSLKPTTPKKRPSKRSDDIDDDLLEAAGVNSRQPSKEMRSLKPASAVDDLLEAVTSPPNDKPKKLSKVRDWVDDDDDVDDNFLDALVIPKTKKAKKPTSSSSSHSKHIKQEEDDEDLLDAILPSGPRVPVPKSAAIKESRHHAADFSDSDEDIAPPAATHDPIDDLIADAMDED
ncbi:hypothetical protein CALCODRAFT_520709 [Calocera cornea HHB12733]|uniref:B30.2/SPRY domain-containing protein n=1 Tax=Calocera cornea HHB12733 TaxID=1353952 RepID=A0A165DBL4_9BASI|nr:hypothetical protein CALCODRAFT_520709 [Calocera cornea HHB12733]